RHLGPQKKQRFLKTTRLAAILVRGIFAPMSDTTRLLEKIEEGIVAHGGELGGWARRGGEGVQLFDGGGALGGGFWGGGELAGAVHAHVFTALHEHDDEVLDACVVGVGEGREASLAQAAGLWITCVAGPIRSFLDNKPVCMTCQAGVEGGDISAGFSPNDY